MHSEVKRLVFSAIALSIYVCTSWGQSSDELLQWSRLLLESGESSIPLIRSELDKRPWPRLAHTTTQGGTEECTASEVRDLASKYLASLAQYDRNKENTEFSGLSESIDTLISLSRTLQESGGYLNYVLADSTNRVIVSRLANFLLNHPSEYNALDEKLSSLHITDLGLGELRMIYQEVLGKEVDLSTLDNSEAFSFLMGQNTKERDSWKHLTERVAKEPVGRILEVVDISSLIQRMVETNRFGRKLLPGLIEYFRKGGTAEAIQTLRPPDLRKVVGTENLQRFSFAPLAESFLYASDLRYLLQFGKNWKEVPFYRAAIE